MLSRCPDACLRQFPSQWLDTVMSDITAAVPSGVLSGTRRSAGVPFFVQAIVTTEPFAAGKACFKRVMKDLILMAAQPIDKSKPQDSSLPQVHARNILRAMYRDTRLGEDVFPFVADGLMVAISGFVSDNWAVRNSSTLLFSALMTRIIGVKKSKDEHSRRNCMTGREFFTRFPTLHSFLLEELQKATETIERSTALHLHPSLYPVLVLLSRLYPSSMDGVDSTLNMVPFVPYIIRCGGSSVMKTRSMAARAIVPLVTGESFLQVLRQLLTSLPASNSDGVHQNRMHGTLLQIQHLIQEHLTERGPTKQLKLLVARDVLPLIEQLMWIGTKLNPCDLTRAVFLEITLSLLIECHWLRSPDRNITDMSQDTKAQVLRMRAHVTSVARDEMFSTVNDSSNLLRMSRDHVAIGNVFLRDISASICLKSVEAEMVFEALHLQDTIGMTKSEDGSSALNTKTPVLAKESISSQDKYKQGPRERSEYSSSPLPSSKEAFTAEESHQRESTKTESTEIRHHQVVHHLLCSPEYEVRLIALEHLSRKMHQSRSNDLSNEYVTSNGNDRAGKESHSSLGSELGKWESVPRVLLEMAMGKEQHLDCLAQVYEVLSSVVDSLSFPMTFASGQTITLTKCWQYVVNQADKPEQRDRVRCALLRFLGCLVPTIYGALETNPDDSSRTWSHAQIMSLLELLRSTSDASESVDMRYTTADILVSDTTKQLLLDPSQLLGGTPLEFWSVVIGLLHDDDPSVRECMARVTCALPRYSSSQRQSQDVCPVVPTLAVKLVFEGIWSVFYNREPQTCLQWILGWICGEHGTMNSGLPPGAGATISSSRDPDMDRLFEKGSLNTYEEDIVIANVVWENLKNNRHRIKPTEITNGLLNQTLLSCLVKVNESLGDGMVDNADSFSMVYHKLLGILAIGSLAYSGETASESREVKDNICRSVTAGEKKAGRTQCGESLASVRISGEGGTIDESLRQKVKELYLKIQRCPDFEALTSHLIMKICLQDLCALYEISS